MTRITLTLKKDLSKAVRAEADHDGGRTISSIVNAALMERYGLTSIPKGRGSKTKKEARR